MPLPVDCLQPQQWLPVVATTVVGVVTGGVALGVAYLGHYFTAKREASKAELDRIQNRKKFLREKLEELVTHVDEYMDSLTKKGHYIGRLAIDSASAVDPGDTLALDQANAITTLYFPDLDEAMLKLSAADLAHLSFVSAELSKIAANVEAWRADSQPTYGDRAGAALSDFITA